MELVIIPLAQKKLTQRGITVSQVQQTIADPEQRVAGYGGRVVYQRRYPATTSRKQLLRVVCEETATNRVVITAYLTSDVERYWRT